jgi:hypothetical protein
VRGSIRDSAAHVERFQFCAKKSKVRLRFPAFLLEKA